MTNDAPLLVDVSRLVWRRWAGTRATGIDRICLAWMKHYASQAQAVLVSRRGQAILSTAASQALFRLLSEPDGTQGFRLRLAGLLVRHGTMLAANLPGRGRVWLNAGHTGLDVDGLSGWCRRTNVRPIYLVHDLIPITHPQFCRDGEEARHRRRIHTMLTTGAGIVANSRHTLETTAAFAANEGLDLPSAVVAWPGTQSLTPSVAETPSPPVFVILGTIEGRKNHLLLFRVWERLWQRHGPGAPQLLVIGRRGWQAKEALDWLDARPCGDRVVEAGPVDDETISAHLGTARALLFPSFAEGFGMPMVEALAAGLPVIASDLPVFHEIGQGVPDLLPPDHADGWERVIMDYAENDSRSRAAQMHRLSYFETPDWQGHFKQVDALIAAV
jgi:glycosyltransferase involved in cell wall biosynthesis